MLVLVDHRANRFHRTFHDAAHHDPLPAKLNSPRDRAGDIQKVIQQMRQLPQLTFNDHLCFSLRRVLVLLQLQQFHGAEHGGKRIAKFMAEHRQEFIFAAIEFGQRCRMLDHLSLHVATFADVTDIALDDFLMPLRIDVADELDFDVVSATAFQR